MGWGLVLGVFTRWIIVIGRLGFGIKINSYHLGDGNGHEELPWKGVLWLLSDQTSPFYHSILSVKIHIFSRYSMPNSNLNITVSTRDIGFATL